MHRDYFLNLFLILIHQNIQKHQKNINLKLKNFKNMVEPEA